MCFINLIKKHIVYFKRVGQLINLGWYRNMAGGFTDSHCIAAITNKDLFNMTDEKFEKIN